LWYLLPNGIAYHFSMIYNVWAALGIWGLTFAERLVLRGKITPNPDDVEGLKSFAKGAASYILPALGNSRVASPLRGVKRRATAVDAIMNSKYNDHPFCLVHGVAGWGSVDYFPSYWAGAEQLDRRVFQPALGKFFFGHQRRCPKHIVFTVDHNFRFIFRSRIESTCARLRALLPAQRRHRGLRQAILEARRMQEIWAHLQSHV